MTKQESISKETPNKKEKQEPEIPEEDQELVENLEMLVSRLEEKTADQAIEMLGTLIRSSTSSMTSVPKPLKYLRKHFDKIIAIYEKTKKPELADLLSVLSMSFETQGQCLKYRMLGSKVDVGSWGHEYVRHLAGEIIAGFDSSEELTAQAMELIPFFMKHNAEADACDLLIEIEKLTVIPEFIDKENCSRVSLYLLGCAPYVTPPDDIAILKVVHAIFRKQKMYPSAIQVALKLNDHDLIKEDFNACEDPIEKKQLAYILARQQTSIEVEDEELEEILHNTKLNEHFLSLGRDLDVLEPKIPEDIYKSHLENVKGYVPAKVDSARQNLAATYVNAFLNAGFGKDKLMMGTEEGGWIYKNKDQGMLSAAASLGVIMLWDVDNGLSQIDKYLYSTDDFVKAGALLSIGLVTSGVKNEADPALALLSEQINAPKEILRLAAIMGLGIAYAGTEREEVLELLLPLVADTGLTMELSAMAALSLGMVFASSCHGEITSTILQTLMERDDTQLHSSFARMMATGLGLLFLGKQEASDAPIETLKVIENRLAEQAQVIVEVCAYAGTGNVLKIQKMLHYCNDHFVPVETKEGEEEPLKQKDSTFQGFAVLGISMIAMGEEIGSQMAIRQFAHLLHYGEAVIRRAVPLAIGLLMASNPLVQILDTLSKYSHDHDKEVSINAIFAMGLVGAGTNNARLAQMLRQLATYYHKEADHLFMVRIAQGLLHMGKGTMTINPFTCNRSLMSIRSVAALFTLLVGFTEHSTFVNGNYHWFLYLIIPAMYPRLLMTVDEKGAVLPSLVRVGQAVDVVGQAGRPKTITGFQTHTTPVLLAYNERAELASEEYIAVSDVLEGFVILKKNPEYMEVVEKK